MITMPYQPSDARIDAVIDRYFLDEGRVVRLAPGEQLMREGGVNLRLYHVRSGQLAGHIEHAGGMRTKTFLAEPGDMVGVQSFFSTDHVSAQTILAVEPCELAWIDRGCFGPDDSVEEALMPVVLAELIRRQRMVVTLAEQHRDEQDQIERLERYSFLGQLAAGVAHELNNALTVLVRGTEWVGELAEERLAGERDTMRMAFTMGMTYGRSVSTSRARQKIAELKSRLGLTYAQARKLAQMGMDDQQLDRVRHLKRHFDQVVELWELGATLNDMHVAAQQAEHVVASMKNLGARQTLRDEPVDINDTIHVALKIMRNTTKDIVIEQSFGELEPIRGNRGELVQVWSNLIKNASEAINGAGLTGEQRRRIIITTEQRGGEAVVTVDDSGPGIPESVLPRIFAPDVTTKKSGLNFGLGLGLSIVRRFVTDYGGDVVASNTDRGARFAVTLPTGDR